jgi:DNA-binding LacI/PurR family transcriptional regulator
MPDSSSIFQLENTARKKAPLYEQIRRKLRTRIEAGSLKAGDRLPSIYALADKLGVNYRTVRTAIDLLENDGLIVCRPNKGAVVAGNAVSDKQFVLSYIRWQRDAFCINISNGIRQYCQEHDLAFRMLDASRSHQIFLNAIANPVQGADGVLIVPEPNEEYRDAVAKAVANGSKMVLLDRSLPGVEASTVCPDHFSGAYEAVSHLIDEHSLPVYYLGRTETPSSCKLWVEGWKVAMRDSNFFDLDKYCFDMSPFESGEMGQIPDANFEAAKTLLSQAKEDKVCVFGNNYVARGIYRAAEELGLKIGKDIFVVGAGDAPDPETFDVALTCISQKTEGVGYEGARVLHELMKGDSESDVHILLPTELTIRQSSLSNKGL